MSNEKSGAKRIIGRQLAQLTEAEVAQVGGGAGDWVETSVSTNIGPSGDTEKQMDRVRHLD